MTAGSTTIRGSVDQRERLRHLAEQRSSSMAETLDAAREALRRDQFYKEMAAAEAALRSNPQSSCGYFHTVTTKRAPPREGDSST